jgi:ABC-2 type transport system ATP-binding protein
VLLTSHYMADVEHLCRRIILIDRGRLRYDGDLEGLATTISPFKLLKVVVSAGPGAPGVAGADGAAYAADLSRFGEVVETSGGKVALRVRRDDVPVVTARLLAEVPVADLSVENPPLESVIDRVYRQGVAA